jgi:hypothetical protein
MNSIATFFKNFSLGKLVTLIVTPVISVIISMKVALLGLWFLIFIDLMTGIRKNLHKNGVGFNPFKKIFWLSIKSYALRQTWRKTYEYGVGIIIIVVFESLIFGVTPIALVGKNFTIAELSVIIPAAVEIWSIYENMEAVSGNNILNKIKLLLPKQLVGLFSSSKKQD